MTLSNRTWNRLSRRDVTVKTIEQRSRRMIRLATVGIALAAVGIGTPAATLAGWDTLEPGQTANERSIALIEGMDPANSSVTTAVGATFDPPTQNERSIALTESKESVAFVPPTANERSIAQIESKEAPGGILTGGVPETVPSGNG
jgi:hypothetical protein